jgi:hypothetical protein
MGTVAGLLSGAGVMNFGATLAYTRGGVTVNCDESINWVDVDQEIGGVDGILVDEVYTMKTNIAEALLANIEATWDASLTAQTITFGGGTLTELADVTVIGTGEASYPIRTVTFFKAISIDRAELSFVKDDITLVPITLRAIVDTSKAVGAKIGTVVDSAPV